jgi:hypothetical protein
MAPMAGATKAALAQREPLRPAGSGKLSISTVPPAPTFAALT